jgi:hypothetical protein
MDQSVPNTSEDVVAQEQQQEQDAVQQVTATESAVTPIQTTSVEADQISDANLDTLLDQVLKKIPKAQKEIEVEKEVKEKEDASDVYHTISGGPETLHEILAKESGAIKPKSTLGQIIAENNAIIQSVPNQDPAQITVEEAVKTDPKFVRRNNLIPSYGVKSPDQTLGQQAPLPVPRINPGEGYTAPLHQDPSPYDTATVSKRIDEILTTRTHIIWPYVSVLLIIFEGIFFIVSFYSVPLSGFLITKGLLIKEATTKYAFFGFHFSIKLPEEAFLLTKKGIIATLIGVLVAFLSDFVSGREIGVFGRILIFTLSYALILILLAILTYFGFDVLLMLYTKFEMLLP